MAAWARGRSQRRRVPRAPPRASPAAQPHGRGARRERTGLGVPGVACSGPSPIFRGPLTIFGQPQDRVPEATVLFLADEEKAAGESRLLLAAGPLAGMLAKGSSLPS